MPLNFFTQVSGYQPWMYVNAKSVKVQDQDVVTNIDVEDDLTNSSAGNMTGGNIIVADGLSHKMFMQVVNYLLMISYKKFVLQKI